MIRMDVDEVFETLCHFGYHQKKIFWTIALSMIFTAYQQVHNVYLGATPEFVCMLNKEELSKCSEQPCDSIKFTGNDFTSIVSEWELVCDRNYLSNMVQSVFMGGILTGSLVFGWVADRFGRKHTVYICLGGMGLFSFIGAFAQSYNFYVLMRLLVGVCCGGWGLVSFVLMTELIGATKRGMVAMVMPITFALGIISFSLLAYFIRTWRLLTIATSLPGLAAVYLYLITPESPRWLASQGRIREAERALERLITLNTGSPPKEAINLKEAKPQQDNARDNLLDLVRNRELLKRTVISIISWFVNCAVYYGLTMGAGSLGSSMYISVALSGFVEIPAYGIGLYIINKFGRRHSVVWTMVFGGIACLVILGLPEHSYFQNTASAMMGKMCISISFSVAWCYTAELYPTSIRNQAMSVCNMAARLGGVASPMLMQLSHTYPSLDYFTFGVMSLVSGLLCLKLPETLGMQLPETVGDLDENRAMLEVKVKDIPEDKLRLLEKEITAATEDNSDFEL